MGKFGKKKIILLIFIIIVFFIAFFCIDHLIYTYSSPQKFFRNDILSIRSKTVLETEQGMYWGETKDDIFDGKGTYKLDTGSSFNGTWKNNKIDGNGILVLKRFGTYKGQFQNGKRVGEGTFHFTNGDVYSGHWKNDVIEGRGKLTKDDGAELVGIFKNGELNNGSYIWKTADINLVVTIKEFDQSKARLTLKDGTVYSGEFSKGQFNGDCLVAYSNGDKYDGNLDNNQKCAIGKYTWKDGSSYSGEWNEDKMNGKGIYEFNNGDSLEGSFKDNKPEGTLKYTTQEKYYSTEWVNGACTKVEELDNG